MQNNANFEIRALLTLADILKDCKNCTEKTDILKEFKSYNSALQRILFYAYSPSMHLPVNIPTIPNPQKHLEHGDRRLKHFLNILDQLRQKEISINAANKQIQQIFDKITVDEINLYKDIIDKRLFWGLSIHLINQIFPNLIMLPVHFQRANAYNSKFVLDYPIWAEPRVNGVRVKIFAMPNGEYGAYTKGYVNYSEIFTAYFPFLLKLAKSKNKSVEIDGHLYYSSWKRTSVLMDNTDIEESIKKLTFHAFDALIGTNKVALHTRKKHILVPIVNILEKYLPRIEIVPHVTLTQHEQLRKCFSRATYKKYSELVLKSPTASYQELVLKDPKAGYHPNKSNSWLVMCCQDEEDAQIIDIISDKTKTTCSCILCKLCDSSVLVIDNLTQEQKEFLWSNKNQIIGNFCSLGRQHKQEKRSFLKLKFDKSR